MSPQAHAGGAAIPAEDEAELAQLHIPLDEHNATMLDCVHPHKWQDPEPAAGFEYDLLALGAGAGGLVSAKQTARRGGKSALVEMHMHGGDCLTVGCVPSKALIRAARAVREVRRAAKLGVVVGEVKIDFPFIMERMRKLRARIAPVRAPPPSQTRRLHKRLLLVQQNQLQRLSWNSPLQTTPLS